MEIFIISYTLISTQKNEGERQTLDSNVSIISKFRVAVRKILFHTKISFSKFSKFNSSKFHEPRPKFREPNNENGIWFWILVDNLCVVYVGEWRRFGSLGCIGQGVKETRRERFACTAGLYRDALYYSVMQSDGNSLKMDTFRETITSELMISY